MLFADFNKKHLNNYLANFELILLWKESVVIGKLVDLEMSHFVRFLRSATYLFSGWQDFEVSISSSFPSNQLFHK